jgi:transcriptional regulator with XRE-family HTH domain
MVRGFMGKTTFGSRLSEKRKAMQLTRDNLAEIAGVSVAAVGHWETDKYLPDLDKCIKLADALKVSLDWLLCRPVADIAGVYDYRYSPEMMRLVDRFALIPPFEQDSIRVIIDALAKPFDPRYQSLEYKLSTAPKASGSPATNAPKNPGKSVKP